MLNGMQKFKVRAGLKAHTVLEAHLSPTLNFASDCGPVSREAPHHVCSSKGSYPQTQMYPSSLATTTGAKDVLPLTPTYLFQEGIYIGHVSIPKPILGLADPIHVSTTHVVGKLSTWPDGLTVWQLTQ